MKQMNRKDNFKCQLCEAVFLDNRQLVIHQTKHTLDIYHCLNLHCLKLFRSCNNFLGHSEMGNRQGILMGFVVITGH